MLFIVSCSSDPCEGVSCINGSCVDGTCQCEEGFTGASCNELACVNGVETNGSCQCLNGFFGTLCDEDYFGTFALSLLSAPTCDPDYFITPEGSTPDRLGNRICFENGAVQSCFEYGLVLSPDFTFTKICERFDISDDGSEEMVAQWNPTGIFSINGTELLLEYSDGGDNTLSLEDGKIVWRYSSVIDSGTTCSLRDEYTKVN